MNLPVIAPIRIFGDLCVAIGTILLWLFKLMPEIAAFFAAVYTAYRIYDLWDSRRRKP